MQPMVPFSPIHREAAYNCIGRTEVYTSYPSTDAASSPNPHPIQLLSRLPGRSMSRLLLKGNGGEYSTGRGSTTYW